MLEKKVGFPFAVSVITLWLAGLLLHFHSLTRLDRQQSHPESGMIELVFNQSDAMLGETHALRLPFL